MASVILTLNAGSSSLKFALYKGADENMLRGVVEGVGQTPRVSLTAPHMRRVEPPDLAGSSYEAVLDTLLRWLNAHLDDNVIGAVGHRIVHGGQRFVDPVCIDETVLAELDGLVPLAPLHQPHNLAAIRAIARAQPALLQVGCFDTAFHRTMPAVATRLALKFLLAARPSRVGKNHKVRHAFLR